MLPAAGSLLQRAYDVWPSHGGAIVLQALALSLLLTPLTLRHARAARDISALQPAIERIRRVVPRDGSAQAEAIAALYRQHGINPAAGCLMSLAWFGALAVLAIVLRGLTTLDPANGNGPKYVERGSRLWKSVVASGGKLSSLGLDLGATPLTSGAKGKEAATYLFLSLGFAASAAIWAHVLANGRRGSGAPGWAAFFAAAALPAAIVIHLVTMIAYSSAVSVLAFRQTRKSPSRPFKSFRTMVGEAKKLTAAGRDRDAAARRMDAVFLVADRCSSRQLARRTDIVHRELLLALPYLPSRGLAAFAAVADRCPTFVSDTASATVIDAWVRSPHIDSFEMDWASLHRVLRIGHDPLGILLDRCQAVGRNAISPELRRQATVVLLSQLDDTVAAESFGADSERVDQSAFRLVELLAHDQLSRGDLFCVLADRALAREAVTEALARYRVSVRLGSEAGRVRLAYQRACAGHSLLQEGELEHAFEMLSEASELTRDPEYDFFSAVSGFLAGTVEPDEAVARLEALDAVLFRSCGGDLWLALAQLRRGDRQKAVTALNRFEIPNDQHGARMAREALTFRLTLEKAEQPLIDHARRLAREGGEQWLDDGPTDPWPMLAAVARGDPGLLAEMIAVLPHTQRLPGWMQLAGSRTLLEQAVRLARQGSVGEATGKLELAERLLGVR